MNIKIYNKKFDLTPAFKKYLKEKLQGLKKSQSIQLEVLIVVGDVVEVALI